MFAILLLYYVTYTIIIRLSMFAILLLSMFAILLLEFGSLYYYRLSMFAILLLEFGSLYYLLDYVFRAEGRAKVRKEPVRYDCQCKLGYVELI